MSGGPKYCWARYLVSVESLKGCGAHPFRTEIPDQRPLLDKSCRPVSAEEDRRIRRARSTEPPVFLETDLNLTVEERMAIEEAEAEEGTRPHLSNGSVSYLWLINFISSFLVAKTFEGVLQSLDA